ncbi:MAG TPA: FAD-dependent oxidoreductase, partial [bacterium]|nr:FAD-dependent oxidoreductase [bacterium]
MIQPPWFPSGRVARTRHALVIGAGIAGASVARSLAERGFAVQVFERHALPAQEASGNPAGIVLPVLSRTGNELSRLTQLGMAYAQQRMTALMQQDARVAWQPTGVLRLARSPRHAAQQEKIAAQQSFSADFARWVDAEEGSALVGVPVEQPGWWFAGGGSVCPPANHHPGCSTGTPTKA